jgi:flagellar motor switch protein FliN/FliY
MSADAIEPIAQVAAETIARGLAERDGAPFSALDVAVREADADVWADRSFPVVVVAIPLTGDVPGESLVLLAPADATALAALDPADELGEPELVAIALAFDALVAGALGEHALGTASARLAEDASEIGELAADTWLASYRLSGERVTAEVVQSIPGALAPTAPAEAESEPEAEPIEISEEPAIVAASADGEVPFGVQRAADVAADATASVLSDLFSEDVSTSTPVVQANPADPFGTFDFPVVLAEVSFVAGVSGTSRFVLVPGDAALLAAAMMGTPETTGDGLSPIELSAVSEAMNQLMTATAMQLAKGFDADVEVSPPTCVVLDSPEQARERVTDCAYRATFTLASTIFGAEIVQLVSAELADSLEAAFAEAGARAAADPFEGFGDPADFADLPLGGAFAVETPAAEVKAGAREILSGIRVRVSAELGRAKLPIARVANLPAGSVVMLDRAPTDPVDVLVNGTPFAQAKVVLVDGEYAVQIISLTPLELTG